MRLIDGTSAAERPLAEPKETHTMATTITLPNGVRIDTTDDASTLLAALNTSPLPQPKAEAVTQPKAETVTRTAPKATKRTTQPKAAKMDGKALWASITSMVAEGNYDGARQAAAVKPDTFGVQCEAAIARHMAKQQPKAEQPKVVRLPEGKQTRKARQRSTTPKAAERHPVLDEVQPEPTKAEKRAAKQQAAKVAARPRNHKPDCGCVTCPEGVAKRQARKVAAPKADVVAEGQSEIVKVTEPTAPKVIETVVQSDPEGIVAKADAECMAMAEAGDVDGLAKASAAYLAQSKRQERLGQRVLADAYDKCVDTADTYISIAREAGHKASNAA